LEPTTSITSTTFTTSTSADLLTFSPSSTTLAPQANLNLCSSSISIYDSSLNFLKGACIIATPLNFPDAEEYCKQNNFAGLFSVTRAEEWNKLQSFLVDNSIGSNSVHIFGNLNVDGVWKFSDGNLVFSSSIPSIGEGTCLNVYGSGVNQISTSQSYCDDVKMFVCEFGVPVHKPAIYPMPEIIPPDACMNLKYCRYFTDFNFNVNCVFDYLTPNKC
jgi:hypothetical protein